LTVAEARVLVANTPDYLRAKQAGGCPQLKVLWSDGRSIAIEASDTCSAPGRSWIGRYFVDIRAAEVWADVDHKVRIISSRLARVREEVLRRLRQPARRRL
jgi:hypothetical protein